MIYTTVIDSARMAEIMYEGEVPVPYLLYHQNPLSLITSI